MSIVSGIYVILNTRNGKIYLGQAKSITRRWSEHRTALNCGKHQNKHLQSSWNKYGAKAFQFKILERCSVDQLDEREQHYLDIHMPKGVCYNIAKNATAPMRGRKLSDEHRLKLSIAAKGKQLSEEHRCSISNASIGKSRPSPSEEARRKMSISAKHRAAVSEETRQKMSAAQMDKTLSEEHRRKIGNSNSEKYIVVSPQGIEFEIKGLVRFCRENDLDHRSMSAVANGKRTHHKGWKCRKIQSGIETKFD